MKNVPLIINLVTLYAILFQVSILTEVNEKIVVVLFSFSPFLVLYMAYIILKYGNPSADKFDDKFYDDWDYRRNGKEETSINQ